MPAVAQDTLFVTVERGFDYNQTEGPPSGPSFRQSVHCAMAHWTSDPLTVRLFLRNQPVVGPPLGPPADPWAPVGMLHSTWHTLSTKMIGSMGQGARVAGFNGTGEPLAVPGSLADVTVANITSDGAQVRVDGRPLQLDVPLTVRANYTFSATSNGQRYTYAVDEALTFTLRGMAAVVGEDVGLCD